MPHVPLAGSDVSEFVLRRFCPGCRVGEVIDPLTEMLERCYEHPVSALVGTADPLAILPTFEQVASDDAINREFCRLLHGS